MSQSACFSSKILCVVKFWWETTCISNARVVKCPASEQHKICKCPTRRNWQGGKMPHSSPEGGVGVLGAAGIDWCIIPNIVCLIYLLRCLRLCKTLCSCVKNCLLEWTRQFGILVYHYLPCPTLTIVKLNKEKCGQWGVGFNSRNCRD